MSLFCLFCCYVLCSVTSSTYNITASINSIHMLNGMNIKPWQENIVIVLGIIDLNIALRVARPSDLTDQNFSAEKQEMERWDHSNRMSLVIMKRTIPEAFKGTSLIRSQPSKSSLRKLRSGLLIMKKLKLVHS